MNFIWCKIHVLCPGLDSPGLSPPDNFPLPALPPPPAPWRPTFSLPLSSQLISHVAHSPTLPVLIFLGFFGWQLRLLLPPHAGSSLTDFSTLKMEAICSSKTSVHFTGSTWRHIPDDGILHSHRCENLKSYIKLVNKFQNLKINLRSNKWIALCYVINLCIWQSAY
jgi:hypothetical protein